MDSQDAKLFIGGISWDTNENTLKDHFNRYGDVLGSSIAIDKSTGNPRGFGFVWFLDPSSADRALQDTEHVILNRKVEVKKADPRNKHQQNQQVPSNQQNGRWSSRQSNNFRNSSQFSTKKIFVGGLPPSLTEENFKAYFQQFGRITDVVVMHDNVTHKPRGFGFITFESEESVQNVMENTFHDLEGKQVEVKRAIPKDGNNNWGDGFDTRMTGGRGSPFNSYHHGNYTPYGPRFGILPNYPFSAYTGVGPYPYGLYGGGFPMSTYSGLNFGVGSFVPRSPYNGPGMVGGRSSPSPYANGTIYPGYMSSGVSLLGVDTGLHNGGLGMVNGDLNPNVATEGQVPAGATQDSGDELHIDSLNLNGSNDAVASEQSQSDHAG
ncbi:RNA recognition motif domain [Dillenia turbinata]|uniref:RNA recognition motif domain n=1 Tax=Dillenia turbinata TaxID=194707 RepID=A0AAN8VTD4_9MAGN